jgi:hypothetical protein
MSELSLAVKTGTALLRTLRGWIDPNRGIEEATDAFVLEELPRIVALLDSRAAEIQASGCTHEEAKIIAHQVIEAQRRTIDPDKRRRLSNVLVNGLCDPNWNKAKHRLLIRLTSELEEEHIAELRYYTQTPEERQREAAARPQEPSAMVETSPGKHEWKPTREQRERWAVGDALVRELISRGLLLETPSPKIVRPSSHDDPDEHFVDDVELDWSTEVSELAYTLLAHLKDPESRLDD